MTLTVDQVLERRKHIGSSDAPAIVGVDPYRTAGDVWASKVYDLDDDDAGEPALLGNLLEPTLRYLAAKALGVEITVPGETIVADDGILAWNPDGLINDEQGVEGKTTGITEGWGEPDEPNNVPEKVIVQCHHAMAVKPSLLVMWVPVILGRFGLEFRLYRVERNDDLCDLVAERGRAFWRQYVEPKVQPPDDPPSLDVLKRIRRFPRKVVQLPADLVEAFKREKAAMMGQTTRFEQAKKALVAALGDAEAGTSPLGDYTYYEQSRRGYTVEPCTYRKLMEVKP